MVAQNVCENRLETKYIITRNTAETVQAGLDPGLRQEIYNTSHNGKVNTVYFDNNGFVSYRHHLIRRKKRFKVRFRRYDERPNGFIELKEKNNSRTTKYRMPFKYDWLRHPPYGTFVPRSLIWSQGGFIHRFYPLLVAPALLNIKGFKPRIESWYSRAAYKNGDNSFRITFDTDLQGSFFSANSHTQTRPKNLIPDSLAIMEIKRDVSCNDFIDWEEDMLRSLNLERNHFSKYCQGLDSLLGDSPEEQYPVTRPLVKLWRAHNE